MPLKWALVVGVVLLAVGAAVGVLSDSRPENAVRSALGLPQGPCIPTPRDSEAWREEETSLPTARDEARAVSVGDHIFVAGGTDTLLSYGKPSQTPGVREEVRARSLDDMLRFDPATGRFEEVSPLPDRLNHIAMVAHDGLVYVIGGSGDLLFGADPRGEASVYDPATDTWSALPPMPTPRGAAVAEVIDGTIYVAGGMGANGRILSVVEAYDIESRRWRRVAPMPTPREHHASAALDGQLYAMGGRSYTDDSLAVVERYDPRADRWQRLPELPQEAGSFGAVAYAGRVITVGGDDDREGWVTGKLQVFDPWTNTWSRLPSMRTKRHGHAVALHGDRLYTFGGSPCAKFAASDVVESIDLRAATGAATTRRGPKTPHGARIRRVASLGSYHSAHPATHSPHPS